MLSWNRNLLVLRMFSVHHKTHPSVYDTSLDTFLHHTCTCLTAHSKFHQQTITRLFIYNRILNIPAQTPLFILVLSAPHTSTCHGHFHDWPHLPALWFRVPSFCIGFFNPREKKKSLKSPCSESPIHWQQPLQCRDFLLLFARGCGNESWQPILKVHLEKKSDIVELLQWEPMFLRWDCAPAQAREIKTPFHYKHKEISAH